MSTALKACCVCDSQFLVKFRFQIDNRDGEVHYFCSQQCRTQQDSQRGEVHCSVCDKRFSLRYAYQQATTDGQAVYFCSMECRTPAVTEIRSRIMHEERGPMRIAVLNQKGGTGKTTTTVNLAAGLALSGARVLVLDVDSQGHVGISLGVDGTKTIYHILVENHPVEQCVVHARPNLDIVIGNETLAATDIYLARKNENRETLLRERMMHERNYDYILLDCGPSLSLLNMNALTFADHLIVPVSCDYLSLVGVRQVMRTLKNVNQVLLHPISLLGILPTFYDMRNNISDESIKTLKSHFHDKVLPPIRVNTRLKEAPRHQQTIFEYAPDSRGAQDYEKIIKWVQLQRDKRLAQAG